MRTPRVAALLAVLAAVGCRSTAPPAGLGDPAPAPLNDPQITVLDPGLQKWIRFHPARIDHEPDAPLSVEVPVRNLADRAYDLDYRFRFYDAGDMELEPVMSWRLVAIEPRETIRLKANSLSSEAVNYRLELKWAH